MTVRTPTYAILGTGGHKVNIPFSGIPEIMKIRSADGHTVNKPIPNYMTEPVGEDPREWPQDYLAKLRQKSVVDINRHLCGGYFEWPLQELDNGHYMLKLERVDLERFMRNAQKIHGEGVGAVISEISVLDQDLRPMYADTLFTVIFHGVKLVEQLVIDVKP